MLIQRHGNVKSTLLTRRCFSDVCQLSMRYKSVIIECGCNK